MKIRLTDYDANWVQLFESEKQLLLEVFREQVIRLEHFGSTSVPGLKAKPVIDMMCIIHDFSKVKDYYTSLYKLGYEPAGEWGIPGRQLFRKGGEARTHHLHVYQFDNPEIERHLVLRDYLRCHIDEVEQYGQLKAELAARLALAPDTQTESVKGRA